MKKNNISVSLSIRECNVNGDIKRVSIRDHRTKEIKTIDFLTSEEAYSFYMQEIESKKVMQAKETDPTEQEPPPEKTSSEEFNYDHIIAYVKDNEGNKGIKSARHLNKKFSQKLKQKEYNEMLKGL